MGPKRISGHTRSVDRTHDMTQQEQAAEAKPSLLTRVFGSRIAQAVGIFGVAFTMFQGFEPFLKFSRLMAYLVNHWRELTQGLWRWLVSFVHLDLPGWALDLATLSLFILLFTVRGLSLILDVDLFLI
jgi:hypothetical protein